MKVRVNIRCNVSGKIRTEKLNGRDVIIVPSATLPDDIVMNGIQYPKAEIAASYKGLERTPAPLGHPTINGKFISATDPEGINLGWIGAWNANVRQEGGRVLLDKIIDVERANESEKGRRVLEAIKNNKPIHTSTGLLCNLEEVTNGDALGYKQIARNMVWDHDAILLDEPGAATPEQGVGMMVNSKGEHEEIKVINSSFADMADEEVDWAIQSLSQALDKRERAPMLERIKDAIREALGLERETTEKEENVMDKEQFAALSAQVNTLAENQANIGVVIAEAVANAMKPLTDANEALVNAAKAKDEAELAGLVEKIVKANILDEATAKELTLNAARKLAETAAPKKAAPLNGTFQSNTDDGPKFQLPKGEAA